MRKGVAHGGNDVTVAIQALEVWARVGVPEAERARPQLLLVDVELRVAAGTGDALEATVDYAAAAAAIAREAGRKPRLLLETLSRDLAEMLLRTERVRAAAVTVWKRVLPGAGAVWVRAEERR